MNKKVFGVMALLFVVFVGLQFADAVTALPPTTGSTISSNGKMKTTWNLQINGPNHVRLTKKTWRRSDSRHPWRLVSTNIKTLNKINRNRLSISATNPPFTKLVTTRLTAVQYCTLHFRQLLADP